MSRVHMVGPLDLAALRAGMWATASEPAWSLAMKVLDRIEGAACSSMNAQEAQAWMGIVMAPAGLKAAEQTVQLLRAEVRQLREDRASMEADIEASRLLYGRLA